MLRLIAFYEHIGCVLADFASSNRTWTVFSSKEGAYQLWENSRSQVMRHDHLDIEIVT